ncbi:MAG TPA: MFS transporter [Bryobacteraceae bacterium]|nr:MFS transporter [Bryobacteraceae bacterium]
MKKRYGVLLFLIALAIVTFLDRIAIAVAGPRIQHDLHITPPQWGWVLGVFVLSYGIFEIPTGALGDRIGQRRVLTRIVLWWSAFTSLTGLAAGFRSLLSTRFLFGIGEAGAYPNISGALARWFPASERARTQGFIWAASRLGGALSPLLVVPLQELVGWRTTFGILGVIGFTWAVCWHFWYHDHPADQPGISREELQRIADHATPAAHGAVPWRKLFSHRQLWLIIIMYWCYAWGSWFYFGWFPVYLVKGVGFSEAQMGIFTALPFLLGTAGNLVGGFLSDRLAARFGLKIGRRLVGTTSLAVSALLMASLAVTRNQTAVVILSSLGFGIADLMLPAAWAVCMDVGCNYAGVVTGAMNTAGQFGGFACSVLFGYVVQATNSYNRPLFLVAAMVMVAAVLFAFIDPTKELVKSDQRSALSPQL